MITSIPMPSCLGENTRWPIPLNFCVGQLQALGDK
jgi:hypothetical protein